MNFYAPKDFKKGRLIVNRYRFIDIVIMIISFLLSFSMCIFYAGLSKHVNIFVILIMIVPGVLGLFLVQPFGIYHNFFIYFQVITNYYLKERKYIWGGIIKNEEKEG